MFASNLEILQIFSGMLTVYASIVSTYVFYALWKGKRLLDKKVSQHFSELGKKSGMRRQQIAFSSRLIEDAISQQNPALALVIKQMFPGAYKWLARNPQALPAIMQMLSKLGGGNAESVGVPGVMPDSASTAGRTSPSFFENELKKEV